ncbi:DUF4438 domain-containing protein [Actinoplanes sp. N902-109]|uniref:DUF4438 family protein n=1 Tax=Actinoplanes sp. (strain N902-109) TaxID=649831 RepID=UPI0003296618|nr:DUF4438 domain-containing protein [Actinoplanes sp. N902-109]AGL16259.1 hypothetical protein L083_2749 [Actinoplanes sp. N902-109]
MKTVAMNLGGVVETPQMPSSPYLVDVDGHPYVPIGTAGIVLGVRLGDGVFDHDADHAAPGVTLAHADQAARHGLTALACLGNEAVVHGGAAAGRRGRVLGKRGEQGRVIVVFPDDVLALLLPGDPILVRAHGQGAAPVGAVTMINTDPDFLDRLPIAVDDGVVRASVRAVVPSALAGNGIGRPAHLWDLDLQVTAVTAAAAGLSGLRLGDLVAIDDLDVRHNAGYRRGWRTVGLIVHGGSPQPGHGPGLMPMFCGPQAALTVDVRGDQHRGVTADDIGFRL